MEPPLLQTKLYFPPLPSGCITRFRLIERLNKGLSRKLTLVAAPAGFGKTTLVGDWLRQSSTAVAWLSLDEADNDPQLFWTYVIVALQTAQPGLGQMALTALQSPQPPPLENLLTHLINDIISFADPIVLVLEEYHLITTLEIHQSLKYLLDHLPSPMHIVVTTREDPPLALPQLRVRQQMTELRANDLRFTTPETAQFLNETMGLDLSPENVAALERRTEGWVAGLQMAALSLQSATDATDFIQAFAGDDHYIADYLISEVIERQPVPIQTFLLKTSMLDKFTVSLCNAVTERDDGRDSLAYLERTNLFLISLDNKREWYRYHHLFRDLLRYRLVDKVGEDGVKQLHRRAAAWYSGRDCLDEAIHHYLAAQDWAGAADLIETVGVDFIVQGQLRKILGWLELCPEDFIRARPLLCVCHAWILNVMGQPAAVELRLQDAAQILRNAPPTPHEDIWGLIAMIRAYLVRNQGDMSLSTEYLRQAAALLSPRNLMARASVNLNLGFNYTIIGQLSLAEQTLQAARRDGQAGKAVYITLIAMAVQANTYAAQGRLRQAMRLYEETIAYGLTHNGGQPFPPAGYAYAGLGQVFIEQNDLVRAEQCLSQAVELGELMADWSMTRRGLLPLAWLRQIQGDSTTAQGLWQKALSVVQQAESKRLEPQLRVQQARLWLAQATILADQPALTAAVAWAEAYQQSKPDPTSYPQTLAQLTLAWLRLLQGQAGQALAGLELVATVAVTGGHVDNLIKILALQALAHAALADLELALAILQQSFELAAPEGYARTFIDLGPPMQRLLQQAAAQGIAPAYVTQLLSNFPASPEDKPIVNLVEPLNDREQSILQLMAAGLSNREIAEELYLSVNTIKWYTTHIYGKLGVNSRTKAVARAQDAGLL